MAKELLDVDPLTGLITYHEYDELTDETTIHYEQDTEPFLESNKKLLNLGPSHYKKDPDFWHAASIPVGIIMKWRVEEGIDVYDPSHWDAVKRKLNDPEYRYLRTGDFRL